MRRRSLLGPAPLAGKINLVPIIDVALVLVVILLITAPVLHVRDMGIVLPEARSRSGGDELRVSVSLGRTGELAVDETLINPDALVSEVSKRISSHGGDILVVVRADSGTPYSQVAGVLRQVKAAGAQRIAIAAQPTGRPMFPVTAEPLSAARIRP
jgi:biopolymer transport protein ExbD